MQKLPFYNPELHRAEHQPSDLALHQVVELCNDPRLAQEISAGNVTLAMIRPSVGPEANIDGLPDQQASEHIEEMIEGLGMLAKFSFTFSREAVEEFYQGGPRASMLRETPKDPQQYDTKWPEFVDSMLAGPTTFLLLHSPDGDAIQKWRAHLGHWNIDVYRDTSTIRGKFGVSKHNNLVHGSDSPVSAAREIGIIKRCVERQITSLE